MHMLCITWHWISVVDSICKFTLVFMLLSEWQSLLHFDDCFFQIRHSTTTPHCVSCFFQIRYGTTMPSCVSSSSPAFQRYVLVYLRQVIDSLCADNLQSFAFSWQWPSPIFSRLQGSLNKNMFLWFKYESTHVCSYSFFSFFSPSFLLSSSSAIFSHSDLWTCWMRVIYLYSPQDQYANSLMHDANMTFRVPLHRMVGTAAIISMCTFS